MTYEENVKAQLAEIISDPHGIAEINGKAIPRGLAEDPLVQSFGKVVIAVGSNLGPATYGPLVCLVMQIGAKAAIAAADDAKVAMS